MEWLAAQTDDFADGFVKKNDVHGCDIVVIESLQQTPLC